MGDGVNKRKECLIRCQITKRESTIPQWAAVIAPEEPSVSRSNLNKTTGTTNTLKHPETRRVFDFVRFPCSRGVELCATGPSWAVLRFDGPIAISNAGQSHQNRWTCVFGMSDSTEPWSFKHVIHSFLFSVVLRLKCMDAHQSLAKFTLYFNPN